MPLNLHNHTKDFAEIVLRARRVGKTNLPLFQKVKLTTQSFPNIVPKLHHELYGLLLLVQQAGKEYHEYAMEDISNEKAESDI